MTRSSPKRRGVGFEGLRRRLGLTQGEDPGAWDPRAIDRLDSTVGRLFGRGCYFDTSVEGFERLPAPPVLLVSNHSGGTSIPDVWGLGLMWCRHFGRERPLHVLGHELLFATPWSGRFFERCGVLRGGAGRLAGRGNPRRSPGRYWASSGLKTPKRLPTSSREVLRNSRSAFSVA